MHLQAPLRLHIIVNRNRIKVQSQYCRLSCRGYFHQGQVQFDIRRHPLHQNESLSIDVHMVFDDPLLSLEYMLCLALFAFRSIRVAADMLGECIQCRLRSNEATLMRSNR